MMLFEVLTLFPRLFDAFLEESLIGKARIRGIFDVRVTDVRDFATDRHHTVDDRPFGGGPGMVMMPEPLARAIDAAKASAPAGASSCAILLSPTGRRFDQETALRYAGLAHLILVCGRYEGVDERISRTRIDEELSLGDFVLSGGEIPAMAVIEAVTRLLPGVLGKEESAEEDTFMSGLLEYPQYTRPRVFENLAVPEVLLSGNHDAIRTWRRRQSLSRTRKRRPDLLAAADLSAGDKQVLQALEAEEQDRGREPKDSDGA